MTLIFIANDFAMKTKLIWVHSFITYATFSEKLKFQNTSSFQSQQISSVECCDLFENHSDNSIKSTEKSQSCF